MAEHEETRTILTADIGSASTKVALFACDATGYSLVGVGRAATTWSAEGDTVMPGLVSALGELEAKTGRVLVEDDQPLLTGAVDDRGADILVATSSAAGGMRLLCLGLVRMMTAESAERAALGAGATVSAVVATDDGRTLSERLDIIRNAEADMILMAGGTDTGTVEHVVGLAEYLVAAGPKPRLGDGDGIPIIFAGNVQARQPVASLLGSVGEVHVVENLRPSLEEESLEPVRKTISDLYLEHVARRTPGYADLLYHTGGMLEPTPAATGRILRAMATRYGVNVLGVDMGSATVDVFSIIRERYNRSVSGDLGVGYSASGVLDRVGVEGVSRWLHHPVDRRLVENWAINRTLRPGTVPETARDLDLLHSLARESLRIAFEEHRELVVGLRGIKQYRTFDDTFEQTKTGQPLVEATALDVIVGTGSILGITPSPAEAALLLLDGIQPAGISRLYVDREGLLAQVGSVMEHAPDLADAFFTRWLLPLATVVAPTGEPWGRHRTPIAEMYLTAADGERYSRLLRAGELEVIPLATDRTMDIDVIPRRNYDLGDGPGKRVSATIRGGEVGLIIDARGRPLQPSGPDAAGPATSARWRAAMGLTSEEEARSDVQ